MSVVVPVVPAATQSEDEEASTMPWHSLPVKQNGDESDDLMEHDMLELGLHLSGDSQEEDCKSCEEGAETDLVRREQGTVTRPSGISKWRSDEQGGAGIASNGGVAIEAKVTTSVPRRGVGRGSCGDAGPGDRAGGGRSSTEEPANPRGAVRGGVSTTGEGHSGSSA